MTGCERFILGARKWRMDSRMLKRDPIGVLGSTRSSTYPKGYASGLVSPVALLEPLLNILPR